VVSPDVLSNLLLYEPKTGKLYWLKRDRDYFPSDWSHKVWNKRYSDVEAFTTNTKGYLSGRIFDKGYLAHRVCFALFHGHWPKGGVDHIDGDPSNNTIGNLRDVTSSENSRNTKRHSHNTSGVTGVYFESYTDRWVVSAEKHGKRLKRRFLNKDDAVSWRKQLDHELGFHENHGRYE